MNSSLDADFEPLNEKETTLILPDPRSVFKNRAARLRKLTHGNVTREYLDAMIHLVEAQALASELFPPADQKKPVSLLSLDPCHHTYGEIWKKTLELILAEMQNVRLPHKLKEGLLRLNSTPLVGLEFLARAIICRNYDSLNLSGSPFLAAALQVYWTDMAAKTTVEAAERITSFCPVCSSPPVAGVLFKDRGLRYLCCSLCSTQWYVPLMMCTNCRSTGTLFHFSLEGDQDGTKAEACSQCRTYINMFSQGATSEAEAYADDLAAISLDLMMSEKPYSRSGVNLFLLHK